MNIEQNNKLFKWEALINFLREKNERTRRREKNKKKKDRAFARQSLELSPFMLSQLSNTVYQRIELT